MHELSLCQSILNIIQDYAREHDFTKVQTLRFSFGKLSCVEENALDFSFQAVAKGTIAEGAELRFQIHPVQIYCFSCEKSFQMEEYTGECPECGSNNVVLQGGTEELKLLEMEVD